MVRIGEIGAGSIAEALELRIGTRVLAVNGEPVRDSLDFAFLAAENELEIEAIEPDGKPVVYDISRDPSESLGIVPAPDKVRECANECVFCFIDGNPPGARPPLWVRDDDFRLSFTYGSYVTLTNLGPKGLQRLVDQRISPLYVSVHATDPQVRIRLLKNRRAGLIMDQLRLLLDAGLEVHAQVVLCPGWNDGRELDRTIRDLYALGPRRPQPLRGARRPHPLQPEPAGSAALPRRGDEGAGANPRAAGDGDARARPLLVLRRRRALPDRRSGGAVGRLLRRLASAGERGGRAADAARRLRGEEGRPLARPPAWSGCGSRPVPRCAPTSSGWPRPSPDRWGATWRSSPSRTATSGRR